LIGLRSPAGWLDGAVDRWLRARLLFLLRLSQGLETGLSRPETKPKDSKQSPAFWCSLVALRDVREAIRTKP